MKRRQTTLVRFWTVAAVAASILAASSGCSPKVVPALSSLGSSSDEAAKLLARPAQATEFSTLASKLDDLLGEIPKGTTLSASEQASIELAAQRAARLKELARMLGASDDIADAFSKDAVELVTGSLLQNPSKAFREHLDATAQSLLRDTLCSTFAKQASASSGVTPTISPPPGEGRLLTTLAVYDSLKASVSDAHFLLSEASKAADLFGLSNKIVAKASGYVGKLKSTMTAATWQDSGAFHAYMRHCVLK